MDGDLSALQDRLQHRFADPRLLERALTHRSFSAEHNERLEFLGDSVLNLAVAALLYGRLSKLPEGDLSSFGRRGKPGGFPSVCPVARIRPRRNAAVNATSEAGGSVRVSVADSDRERNPPALRRAKNLTVPVRTTATLQPGLTPSFASASW